MAVCIANVPALTQTVTEAPLHDINPTLRGSIVSSSNAGRHLLIVSPVDSSVLSAAESAASAGLPQQSDYLRYSICGWLTRVPDMYSSLESG